MKNRPLNSSIKSRSVMTFENTERKIPAHWVWAAGEEDGVVKYGWLRDLGALDFAGGAVVHMSSGFSALTAAIICGPRRTINLRSPPEGHNIPMFLLGACLLWIGWFGFNGGSALGANSLAALAVLNSQIAAGTGLATWIVLDMVMKQAVTVVRIYVIHLTNLLCIENFNISTKSILTC
jgi:Amt family ammonium transporter